MLILYYSEVPLKMYNTKKAGQNKVVSTICEFTSINKGRYIFLYTYYVFVHDTYTLISLSKKKKKM